MVQLKVKLSGQVAVILQLLFLSLQHQSVQAAYFEGCDVVHNLNVGKSTLNSPYYPNRYPSRTSCRYKFVAPLGYYIDAKCNIDLEMIPSGCSSEFFYISREGDQNLTESEEFCGEGFLQRNSVFNSIVFAYISYAASSGGKFTCSLEVKLQACDCGWSVNTKIVNGIEAQPNQYPHMVALKDKMSWDKQPYCGGAIISHYYVATAAHCARYLPDPTRVTAMMGDHDVLSNDDTRYAVEHAIERFFEHPNYNPTTNDNDIALLKTVYAIVWSRGVGPICLPPPESASQTFAYQYAQVLGWGTTSFGGPKSRVLLSAELMIPSNADCSRRTGNNPPITSSLVCTWDSQGQNRDSCQQDSGGPVVLTKQARQFLVGIISNGAGCGGSNAIGINTRITSYLSWINQYTGQTCPMKM